MVIGLGRVKVRLARNERPEKRVLSYVPPHQKGAPLQARRALQPREPGESRDPEGARESGNGTAPAPTPFTEALSQLNDRALRRLLGARAFLRGYDYVRRQAVTDVVMEDLSAKGAVRGTEPDPYAVKLQVTPSGFTSECSCPAFPKINGHCKHVAALLIALRDQVRPKQPRSRLRPTATVPAQAPCPA